MAYTMKMYDPKGNLVDVDRNKQDSLLSQGYSFKNPNRTPTSAPSTNKSTVNYVEPTDPSPAIRGDAGGIGYSARRDVQGMVNQEPGYEGSYLDGYKSVEDMQKNYSISAPIVNPYEEALKKYQEQINALATETDPDYNENLEQLSPKELEEEIL